MTYKSSDSGVEYVRLMAENGFIRKNIISDGETVVRYQKLEARAVRFRRASIRRPSREAASTAR